MSQLESVDNALRLILLLGGGGRFGVTEVARELSVAPSTAHRLLATLLERGFAEQAPDRSYGAGPALQSMRRDGLQRTVLIDAARAAFERLVHDIGETAHLVVLVGAQIHFLYSVEGDNLLRIGSREGQIMPAHLSASGRVLLAGLGRERLAGIFADPEDDAARSAPADAEPVDLDRLIREIGQVRRRGFAVNRNGTERGVSAVAVPISDGERILAAISVSVPTVRFTSTRIPELIGPMHQAAERIRTELAVR